MRHRYLTLLGVFVLASVILTWAAISITGQTRGQTKAPAAQTRGQAQTPVPAKPANTLPKAGPAPRTPWGVPDLQGSWFVMENVPLERSAANANKPLLTDEEVAALDKQKAVDPGRNARTGNDVAGAYNAVFNSILKTSKRTSMIIDPPDGRIPRIAADAGAAGVRGGGGAAAGGGRGAGGGGRGNPNDNPETTAQNPRCLGVEAPFLPTNPAFAQGTVMQIVQSPKSMAIYMEDDHAGGGNRVIYIDNRPHLPKNIRTYLGDSRAHWEGNTLVVETTNFSKPYAGFRGGASNVDSFKMTERFTRVDANNLRREITFEDPTVWTRPWTVLIEMGKTSDNKHMIFDSACHEGNYGLTGILAGARKEEQTAK
jgi:hypothetical protein